MGYTVISPLEERFWFVTTPVIDISQYGAIETGLNRLLKHCVYKCSSQGAYRLAQWRRYAESAWGFSVLCTWQSFYPLWKIYTEPEVHLPKYTPRRRIKELRQLHLLVTWA